VEYVSVSNAHVEALSNAIVNGTTNGLPKISIKCQNK